jgi:hypothetical protein
MPRLSHQGKVTFLRVHRVLGFGPPSDHISVHAVIRLSTQPNRFMGFRLQQDADRVVHEGWLDMLRDAFNLNHTVIVESDFDTQAGNNGVIRTVVLQKP